MILSLYKKLLEKTPLATSHTPNTNDILDVDSEILTDETIKYKDVAIGLPHKAGARKRANEEAIMLMNDLKSDMREPTDAEKKILQGYTGNGGLGGIGSEDEYYTPAWVAKGAWDMLGDMPNGAKVLDPSAGMGIFARNMPNGIDMTEIELDSTSATLNKMITDLPLLHGTFQEQSYKIEDNSLDGVITNVPFAKVDDIGDERFKGIKRLEQYFIIRSLELLKPSKRAVFLVPTGVLDNNRTRDYKDKILDLASFVGGVRLPNKVFSHTGADVAVDILVFEKHREDAVKALKDNYVTYPSRQEVILGDKQNNAFYFGTYFTTIGKRNLLGKYISTSEFQESHFMGQTAHPKSAVLTTKSLDDIKEQVAKLSKTKFHNTVDYDKLQLLGNVSITDKLALQTLRENDDFRAYFREFDNAIYERKNITVKELKLFAEKYDKFAEKSNNAQLLSIFGRTDLYLPVMAINFHKKKVTKHTLDMLKALIFAKFTNETRTDKENKGYMKHNKELSRIVETPYVKKFKESIEYHDQQRINENITTILAQLTAKLNSNWNFKLNEPIKQLEFKKFKTIEDVLQGKGLNLAKEFNNGGYKASVLTPQEILDIDDVFLAKDGNVTPASWIVYNGSKYKDAISHIDSLEYSKEYGLTEDEFQEKIHSMRGIVNSHKDAVSLDSLTLNHKSVSSLVGENEMPTVKRIAQEIADGMPLAYIKSDNIIKTKNIARKSMGSLDDDKDVVIEEIEEVESIEFPTNFSISTFYAKNWESNFKVLWARHEEAIKQTLGVKDYSEASRQYQYLKAKRDDEGGKNLAAPVEFFGKLKPIIMQDILSYRDSFDMQLDTKLKLNPTVSKKIKETLDRDAIIKISDSQKHEPIESLRRYVNDSVIDTNHGYQNEDIRHFSTALKGTMAQDTGLGKSRTIFMSALLAVTTNRAKRALVVVPTAVYDKWVMEVRDGKDDGAGNKADSILNEEGKKIVTYTKSSTAKKDWSNFIKSEGLRIMLMPHSVFETFVFKKATIKKLFGTSKEEERANKDNPDFRAVPNRLPDFNARDWGYVVKQPNNTIGYFEDGKIDFIVIDEGQMAKNSSTGGKTVKFASAIQSSRYGVVLRTTQAIINNETFNGTGQGVVVATATPFTSSPLEIYTMLKNTGGLDSFDDFTDFEDTFMVVSEREEVMATDPDRKSLVKVFEGLDNLSILRNQGLTSIIYRNAEDESKREVNGSLGSGALKPAKETFDVSLEESEDVLMARADLIQKNGLFKEFKKEVIDRGLFAIPASDLDKSDKAIIASYRQSILSEYGLDITDSIQRAEVARKASTFSLIHGLNMLSINKDMALKDTITLDISNLDKETLEKLTSKLLKTKVQYKDIEQFHDKDGELCEKEITIKVTMDDFLQSRNLQLIKGNILSVPAIDEKIVKTIFDITTDSNLLKIEDYPKYKTVLENISKELKENPKAKQLIFSVSIVGARILEYFVSHLYKELEINPHKVMSALNIQETKAKKGDNEQDVGALAQFQENYNNSKVSTTLIFTTRNSTGVDFNKMTKAIHLVDIPYTPDVWHQAEGRGVRQGNKIDKVHVYQYSATGTLDTMKKVLLSEKGAWQEEIKNNDSVNSISSIQVDGKKLIEEVMASNPNATEDDIRAIIKEKQSEREEIVKKENQLKVEAVKQSVSDSNKLIQLQHETDKTNQLAYLGDYADFKGSAKHVDIFNPDITGKKVLDNLKKNGYKAVQMFVANAISTGAYKDKEALNEELAEITLDMEFVKENSSHRVESQRYLLALLNSTQYDKSKDYYEVSSTYTPAKIIPLSEEEASYKKEAGYKVNKRPLLTDNQYQDANMILEQYLERAKIDIETKVLSVIEAESIFKDAVKNAIGVVNKDEKELYQGLLLGEMIYTISGDIVRLEDSVKQYQGEYRSTYIEVVPNQLISLTDIKPKTYEVTDEYKFLGRVAKTQPNIADALSLYHAAMEKLKDNLERNKNKIVKYFDTPAEAPVFSKDTFKGVGSLLEYLEVLKLVRVDLKDFDKFGELDYIAASSEFIFKGLKDEVVTFGRNTLAIIKGNIFTTTKFIRVRGDEELSSTPILDQAYKTPFNSNRIGDVSKIDQYDYSFLVRVFDAELDDIKGMIRFDSYNFQEINGVLYPYYTPAIAYKEYLEHLGKEEDKAIVAEELSNGGASDQSFDDIMDIINGTTEDKRKDILDSIMALDFQDQKLKSLGEMLQLARDGKIAEYNSHSDESQPIGIHVSTDLKVVVTNGKPINDFKTTRGRGAWAKAGITYNKNSKAVYELDGTQKEYMNTWEIEVTEDNLITARSV